MCVYALAKASSILECACRRRRSGCLSEANPAGAARGRADRCQFEDCVLEVDIWVVVVDDRVHFALEFVRGRLLSCRGFVCFDFPNYLVAYAGIVLVRPVHIPWIEPGARALATASRLTRFARSANLIAFGDRRIFVGERPSLRDW